MRRAAKVKVKAPETKREISTSQTKETSLSQHTNSHINQILSLQRAIGNQAVQRLFRSDMIQAKLHIGAPNGIFMQKADQTADEATRKCSAWMRDRESTSVVAAKHYVKTELKSSHGNPETVICEIILPDRFMCSVEFSDGTIVKVFVRPDVIIIGVHPLSLTPPPDRPLCFYDFDCPPPLGNLVLTKRECKTA